MNSKRVAILGHDGGTNIGGSLLRAANRLGHEATLFPIEPAFGNNRLLRMIAWKCFDHRPLLLNRFSANLVEELQAARTEVLITSGIAPINIWALKTLRASGMQVLNFSTDDPWNRWMSGQWFRQTLPHYSHIFSPRTANIADLQALGAEVSYLPFGYDDELFYPDTMSASSDVDLAFVGAADADRLQQLRPLLQSGLKIAIFGGMWGNHPEARPFWQGLLDVKGLRELAQRACISLICVRRLNRDQHVMRSFEAAASGACMLVEDTSEHRQFFGPDGDCVRYFSNPSQLPKLARELLSNPAAAQLLRESVALRISTQGHRYVDRLQRMLLQTNLQLAHRLR